MTQSQYLLKKKLNILELGETLIPTPPMLPTSEKGLQPKP